MDEESAVESLGNSGMGRRVGNVVRPKKAQFWNTVLSVAHSSQSLTSTLSQHKSSAASECFFPTFGEAHREPDWRMAPAGSRTKSH